MNKQKFLKLFLILIGLLIIVFSGFFVINSLNYLDNLKLSQAKVFFHSKNQNQDQDQTNNDQISDNLDTSNWKTYRNEEFGFEFKYPENGLIEKKSNEDVIIVWQEEEKKILYASDALPGTPYVVIEIKQFQNESIKNETELLYNTGQSKIIYSGKTKVNNYNASLFTVQYELADRKINYIYLQNDKKYFIFSYPQQVKQDAINFYNNVLNSFEFIK